MRPSRRLLKLLLVWVALGLIAAMAPIIGWTLSLQFNMVFWIYIIVLTIVTALDALASRRSHGIKLIRQQIPNLALGVQQSVTIKIRNESEARQTFCLTDSPSSSILLEGLPVEIHLKAHQETEVKYYITPFQRGLAEFNQICCRVLSPRQLWESTRSFGEPVRVKVYPNYKPLFRSSFINSEQLYSDLGVRLQQRRGEGTDFHQLRDFRKGDSLRQVDWRATARFNRPISREYQEERDQQVVFLLDCGRRMRAKDGDISHFDHALNALLLSAFIALRQGDNVGLMSFAGQPRWVAPAKGASQISHLLDQVYDLDSTLATTDYLDLAQKLMVQQPKRSLIILISSIEPEDRDELYSAVELLSQRHLVLVASMRQKVLDTAQNAEIETIDDALSFCGSTSQLQKQTAMFAELRSNNIMVTDTLPSEMHAALINQYMALKRSGIF